jgi:hypothetical protein
MSEKMCVFVQNNWTFVLSDMFFIGIDREYSDFQGYRTVFADNVWIIGLA